MSTHTPGPWKAVEHDEHTSEWIVVSDARLVPVSHVGVSRNHSEQTPANARLIAAAPQLLELARAFHAYVLDDSRSERRRLECLKQAAEVIREATGEASHD